MFKRLNLQDENFTDSSDDENNFDYKQDKPYLHKTYPKVNIKAQLEKVDANRMELQNEIWFHGSITRETAEFLLKDPGDFLVRESSSLFGQIILSCFNGDFIHMTLTDSMGNMRPTQGRFENVKVLVEYYYATGVSLSDLTNFTFHLINPIVSL
jgi:hypothetical protein